MLVSPHPRPLTPPEGRSAAGGGTVGRWRPHDLWLLYPAILFTLPDSVLGALPIAPESIFMLAALYAAVLLDLAYRRGRRVRLALSRIPLPAALFLGAMLLSWSVHGFGGSLILAARLIVWVLTFFFGVYFALEASDRSRFFRLWTVLATAGAAFLIGSPGRWGQERVDIMAFQHRTGFAYFLCLPAALLIFRTFFAGTRRVTPLTLASLALLTVGVLMALSRGAWLVVYMGLIALLVYRGRRVTAAAVLAVSMAGLLSFAFLSNADLALRIRSVWDFRLRSSSLYRLDLLQAAFSSVPEIGPLGSGPGTAGSVLAGYTFQSYRHLTAEQLASGRFVTDSDVVWLLIEAGPVAVAMLFLLMAWWARRLFRDFAVGDGAPEDRAAGLLLLVLFVAMLTFDNVLTIPFGWFLLGVGLGSLPRLPRSPGMSGTAPAAVPARG
jgi:hypothetical protein